MVKNFKVEGAPKVLRSTFGALKVLRSTFGGKHTGQVGKVLLLSELFFAVLSGLG